MTAKVVNIGDAKTHFSRLLARVAAGEEILIARAGHPVARLVPIEKAERRPGRLKAHLRIGRDFDQPLPKSVLHEFEGDDG